MISAKPTKYGSGIEICGDYQDLENLHRTIVDLGGKVPLSGEGEEFVLGLAYETRKAHEGRRDTRRMSFPGADPTIYFVFKELWPTFLMQLGLLRWAAGYQPTSKEQQSNLYRLESCTEEALTSLDPFIVRRCVEWLAFFPGVKGDD